MNAASNLTSKDFTTDQEVRWCPGCGDYAILKVLRSSLAKIGTPADQVALISGIGCAARLPYYIDVYGFHTIHGRACAVASGVKMARPELDVWVAGGDGDLLSIGGHHTLHALRRNIDLNILLFNNAIYGLTKGQYSPTSGVGTRSPSTPGGSLDQPLNAAQFALGANARFVARAVDTAKTALQDALLRAHAHHGASFLEIFQNCIVYNDAVFDHFTGRAVAANRTIMLRHGAPMLFGETSDKGLKLGTDGRMQVIDPQQKPADVHDETNKSLAFALAEMQPPEFPVALGVLYCNPGTEYSTTLHAHRDPPTRMNRAGLQALLHDSKTWHVP